MLDILLLFQGACVGLVIGLPFGISVGLWAGAADAPRAPDLTPGGLG